MPSFVCVCALLQSVNATTQMSRLVRKNIASRLEAIAIRLEAIASRLEMVGGHRS